MELLAPSTSPSYTLYRCISVSINISINNAVQSQPRPDASDTGHNNRHKSHHQMCLLTWSSSLPARSAASHSITLRSTAHPGDCDWNQWAVTPELTEINDERIHGRSRRLRGKLTCQRGGRGGYSFLSDYRHCQNFTKVFEMYCAIDFGCVSEDAWLLETKYRVRQNL